MGSTPTASASVYPNWQRTHVEDMRVGGSSPLTDTVKIYGIMVDMSTFSKHTKESLELIISGSLSIADTLRKLGLRESGGNRTNLKRNIDKYGIDTSHFLGQGHNKNRSGNNKKNCTEYLVLRSATSARLDVRILRRSMIEYGFEYVCSNAACSISSWLGADITLEIDHISGEHFDNRPENLRFLCPNCHSQEPTSSHSWKNAERYGIASICLCGNWKTSSARTCKDCYNSRRAGSVDIGAGVMV